MPRWHPISQWGNGDSEYLQLCGEGAGVQSQKCLTVGLQAFPLPLPASPQSSSGFGVYFQGENECEALCCLPLLQRQHFWKVHSEPRILVPGLLDKARHSGGSTMPWMYPGPPNSVTQLPRTAPVLGTPSTPQHVPDPWPKATQLLSTRAGQKPGLWESRIGALSRHRTEAVFHSKSPPK